MAKAKKETMSLEELLEQAIVKEEDRPYEVPGNWVWTRIKHISKVVTGTTPSKNNPEYYGEEYPFFKPTDLEQGYNVTEAREYLTELGICKGRLIPKFSTLVTCIGATIGKCGFSRVDGSANQQINAMIPFHAIYSKYIYWLINSPFMQDSIISNASSTTLPILNKSRFEELNVPVPPVAEQKRIVEVIESLFEKLDTAKELVQNALDSFESRKAAIIHKAFTGGFTSRWREENGVSLDKWREITLEECAVSMQNGISKRSGKNGDLKVVLRLANIRDNAIDTTDLRSILLDDKDVIRYSIDKDDILIVRVNGSVDNVGKLILIDNEDKWAFCDHLIKLKVNKSMILPKFLIYKSLTNNYKNFIKSNMVSSAGQNTISQKSLNDFILKIPDIKEQQEIIRILDNLLENEQRAKELSDVIEKIDLMKKAILARAFRGELRSNNPEEESAVELLKEVLKGKN